MQTTLLRVSRLEELFDVFIYKDNIISKSLNIALHNQTNRPRKEDCLSLYKGEKPIIPQAKSLHLQP